MHLMTGNIESTSSTSFIKCLFNHVNKSIQSAEEQKKKEGRERKKHRGKEGNKRERSKPVTLGTGIGFDQLFERGYGGDASSRGREFVPYR